jgi:hypothetical protein
MHDEKSYTPIERAIAASAPGVADAAALERVRAAATSETPRRQTALRRSARQVWIAAAVVASAAVAAIVFASQGPHLTMAFAKEDALAALIPKPGYVLHVKSSEWGQNYGEDEAIIPGTEYTDSWTDFAGQRGHTYWRNKSDDSLNGEAVVADGRARSLWKNLEADPPRMQIQEGHYQEGMLAGELYAFEYVRESLPEGEVVGEVVVEGERYWDLRWDNTEDEYGNKINARALFRQPDYRPLRIERDYPGGSKGSWDVLEWEVVPLAQVDQSMFELSSIPSSGQFEERFYLLSELAQFDEFTPWWLGEKLGARKAKLEENLIDKGDHTETVFGEPWFDYRRGGEIPADDPFTGGSYLWMTYTGSKLDTVTVTSMRPLPEAEVANWLKRNTGAEDVTSRDTSAGPAWVATPSDQETVTAYVSAPGATVIIEAPDLESADSALSALRKAN